MNPPLSLHSWNEAFNWESWIRFAFIGWFIIGRDLCWEFTNVTYAVMSISSMCTGVSAVLSIYYVTCPQRVNEMQQICSLLLWSASFFLSLYKRVWNVAFYWIYCSTLKLSLGFFYLFIIRDVKTDVCEKNLSINLWPREFACLHIFKEFSSPQFSTAAGTKYVGKWPISVVVVCII